MGALKDENLYMYVFIMIIVNLELADDTYRCTER